jgi:hypothetical protein
MLSGISCLGSSCILKSINFWDIMPCSPLSVNRRFGETYRLHLQGRRNKFSKKPASKQVGRFLLKMEAICFSETAVDTLRTTRRYIPEVGTFHITAVNSSNPTSYILFGGICLSFSSSVILTVHHFLNAHLTNTSFSSGVPLKSWQISSFRNQMIP